MNEEVCVTIGEFENCTGGETLAVIILVECCFYLFLFLGGFMGLNRLIRYLKHDKYAKK